MGDRVQSRAAKPSREDFERLLDEYKEGIESRLEVLEIPAYDRLMDAFDALVPDGQAQTSGGAETVTIEDRADADAHRRAMAEPGEGDWDALKAETALAPLTTADRIALAICDADDAEAILCEHPLLQVPIVCASVGIGAGILVYLDTNKEMGDQPLSPSVAARCRERWEQLRGGKV